MHKCESEQIRKVNPGAISFKIHYFHMHKLDGKISKKITLSVYGHLSIKYAQHVNNYRVEGKEGY